MLFRSGIKSVGGAVVDRIEAERTKNGPFKDLRNFLTRMPSKDTNKKTVEALILSGAFDDMGANRKQMMMALPAIAEEAARERKCVHTSRRWRRILRQHCILM